MTTEQFTRLRTLSHTEKKPITMDTKTFTNTVSYLAWDYVLREMAPGWSMNHVSRQLHYIITYVVLRMRSEKCVLLHDTYVILRMRSIQ